MHYRKLIALVRRSAAAVVGALVGALALTATAHDIPTDVKINAFVKPEAIASSSSSACRSPP